MVLSRIIYGLPFVFYAALHATEIMSNSAVLEYTIFWAALWLISLFFFSLGRFIPWPMTHFVFFGETILLYKITMETANPQWLLFILMASFFAIEGLRNEAFHIIFHVCMLVLSIIFINRSSGIGFESYSLNQETIWILFSILLCRALMSIMESKNVILQRIVKKIRVYTPVEKENKKAEANMQQKIENHKKYIEELQSALKTEQATNSQLKDMINSMDIMNNLSKEIVNKYFIFSVQPPLQTKMTMDENLDYLMEMTCEIIGASYAAFIFNDTENNDVYLSNSYVAKGKEINEDELTTLFDDKIVKVLNNIRVSFIDGAILHRFKMTRLYLIPCAHKNVAKGVLIVGFDKEDALTNIHYANLALMVAYRIFGVLDNANAMKKG